MKKMIGITLEKQFVKLFQSSSSLSNFKLASLYTTVPGKILSNSHPRVYQNHSFPEGSYTSEILALD